MDAFLCALRSRLKIRFQTISLVESKSRKEEAEKILVWKWRKKVNKQVESRLFTASTLHKLQQQTSSSRKWPARFYFMICAASNAFLWCVMSLWFTSYSHSRIALPNSSSPPSCNHQTRHEIIKMSFYDILEARLRPDDGQHQQHIKQPSCNRAFMFIGTGSSFFSLNHEP